MIIKIQSFIDIITNSSTEVFSIPTYKINEILEEFPHRTYDILENYN